MQVSRWYYTCQADQAGSLSRLSDGFSFFLSFFLTSGISMAVLLQLAWHVPIIRKWHSYYVRHCLHVDMLQPLHMTVLHLSL